MSSHHIVRENQEPALLVQNFKALSEEYFGQILEWSPTIITDEYNLDYFLAEAIKVDIVFINSLTEDVQEQIKLFPITNSFLKDALGYLVANNYKAVNILTDSLPTNLVAFAEKINIVTFFAGKRYVFIQQVFEKWKPKDEKIYISEALVKSFEGLRFLGEGMFQVEQDGFIRLEFNTHDFVLLGEDI